jgi:type II secretory pathway component HofQ
MIAQIRVWLLSLLMVWALSHAAVFGEQGEPAAKEPSPAEKTRKMLDQTMALDYSGASLPEVIQHLKEKTRINFVLDQFALQQMGLIFDPNNGNGLPMAVNLKGDRYTKVRTTLQRTLNAFNLTYAILEDTVLITTEEIGLNRQMRQRVTINLTDVPLSTALKDLARTTALNLVIDPRLGKEANAKVSLQLDDATLETTVRLLAEMANLKSVRMGNVLFLTTEARADKLRREEPPPAAIPGAGIIDRAAFLEIPTPPKKAD